MALVGTTLSYTTYRNDTVNKTGTLAPKMSSNGTWMAENTYSCRSSDSIDKVAYVYRIFNATGGSTDRVQAFNENTFMEVCLPEAKNLVSVDLVSNRGYLPATGIVYYSDDGETYTECGTWQDTLGTSKTTSVSWGDVGAHRIWRLMSTARAIKHPSSNADIAIARFTWIESFEVAYSLPEGMGGWVKPYITHIPHNGLDINKLSVYYTYKRDDLVDLTEGQDRYEISGITEAYVTHKPHDGLDIRQQDIFINYRPHDGLDIRKLEVFATVRDDSKIDTFKIPYGIGGYVNAYVIYRMLQLVGYLYNLTDVKIKGIAVENNYIQLKAIEAINRVSLKNNTTEDLSEGEEDV